MATLTFLFKDIFPTSTDFTDFMTSYDVADMSDSENLAFAQYLYKVMFRRFHNSNIQYDTIEDFECDLANVIEDVFQKYQKQLDYIEKIHGLTEKELMQVSSVLANSANNPNTLPTDPTEPLEFVGAQAFTLAHNGKLIAYLQALNGLPTQLIKEFLANCVPLFKTILPNNEIIIFGVKED